MITTDNKTITVETVVNIPLTKAWDYWTEPKHITGWNFASDNWHTPNAINDLREGGRFNWRMESKDKTMGFDFSGTFTRIEPHFLIAYILDDNRKVEIHFELIQNYVKISETFETENQNTSELQKQGWQSILNNFKLYAENKSKKELLHFDISINATKEIVYKNLIEEIPWKQWTSVFNPSSHFMGSWEKGSKILFLGTDQDGKTGGMASMIRENIRDSFISISHLHTIEDGNEVNNVQSNEWSGVTENYTISRENGITRLDIDMDLVDEYKSYFEETWPKALLKLKEICER